MPGSGPSHWWSWRGTTAAENTRPQEVRGWLHMCLSEDCPLVRLHTCDRKHSVEGLMEIFPDFFSLLFFPKGPSGACKSNLTLVSPTHNARYLLKHKHKLICWKISSQTSWRQKICWQLTANPGLEIYSKSIFCQFPVIKRVTVMASQKVSVI